MLTAYRQEESIRQEQGVPALPLDASQVLALTELLEKEHEELAFLASLLQDRIEPGVAEAARVKAEWLERVATGAVSSPVITKKDAVAILGTMGGGYNVSALIRLLNDSSCAAEAAAALKQNIKMYEAFDTVAELAKMFFFFKQKTAYEMDG